MVKISSKGRVYALGVLAALLSSSTGTLAQIPSIAFKGFSKTLRANKKQYDPVIGAATFEGGFMYDLRFLGNTGPLRKLAEILFPSPSGQLTTERAININFGKNAAPKTVALLQNFAHSLREGEVVDEKQLIKKLLESFKEFKSTAEVPEKVVEAIQNLKNLKETTIGPLINKQMSKQVWTALNKEITSIIKKTSSDDVKKQEIISKVQEYLRKKEEDEIKAKKSAFEKEMAEKTLAPLLTSIKESITSEADSLYLPHTTEQVISTFFSAHFNIQADIREFMTNLDDRIVDKTLLPKEDDYLKQEDLPGIAAKPTPYELDEAYDLAEAGIWTALTPYKDGAELVSNGNTYRYDRKQNKLRTTDEPFADCAEKGAAHVMILSLYNNITRKYDLEPLKKTIKPDNRYFKNFEDFFTKYGPTFANSGDIQTRSDWNKALGDLNAFDDTLHIEYMKGSNELNAGFINFVRVFQKIFGLMLDDLPTTGLQAQKEWLEKSLNTLFTTVNPGKAYQFNLAAVTEKDNDLSGTIGITVGDAKTKEGLFSFDFRSITNVHSDIKNLKTLKKIEGRDYNADLKTHLTTLQPGTVEEVLWLAAPADVRDSKLTYPLYKLFNTSLADNDSKIIFLEKIKENFADWYKTFLSTPNKLQAFKDILGNVLEGVSWDDQNVVERISPVVLGLAQEKELKDIIGAKMKGFSLKNSNLRKIKGLENLPPLKELDISNTKELEEISLKNLESLKSVNFARSKVKKIEGLETLSHVEKLDFSNTEQLEEISLKNLEGLKSVDFAHSEIKKIEGLETLAHLEELNLLDTRQLKEFTLKNMGSLKRVDFNFSRVKKIEVLENLPHLEELVLSNTQQLEDVFLKNLESLKSVDFRQSKVKKIEGLETLTYLEEIDLTNTTAQEISLKNLGSLKKLNLAGSKAKKIEGLETLSHVEKLDFSNTQQLEELSLKNLGSLKSINLAHSGVKKIEGFETLTHLAELDLSDTKQLEEITLSNLKNLKKINLAGSKVKKIEGLEALTYLEELDLSYTNAQEITFKNLGSLKKINLSGSAVKKAEWLENFPLLEELDLSDTPYLEELFFKNLKNLKKINLVGSNVKKVEGLENLTHLEELDVRGINQDISLKGLGNLKKINLSSHAVKKLEGLETLTRLEDLDLSYTDVEKISLKNLRNLKTLTCVCSNIQNIEFETHPLLEQLNLEGTSQLEDISLKNLENLKRVSLMYSKIQKIEGLETLSHLEELELGGTSQLEDISLKNLENLHTLSLAGSTVKKIEAPQILPHLKRLDLSWTDQLEEISLKNLENLTTLSFDHSKIKKIEEVETLSHLEQLNLSYSENITELEFKEDRKNLKINLQGSGIKNKSQIRGIEHLDEKNITW